MLFPLFLTPSQVTFEVVNFMVRVSLLSEFANNHEILSLLDTFFLGGGGVVTFVTLQIDIRLFG